MPELPEVETVRTGLEQAWVGRRIEHVKLRRKDLRFPFPANMAERLTGQTVLGVRRRAKYLLIDLEDGAVFLSHLGMSGRYTLVTPDEVARINPGPTPQTTSPFGALTGFDGRHDHMEFRFDDGSVFRFTPTREGLVSLMCLNVLRSLFNPCWNTLDPNHLTDGTHQLLPNALGKSAQRSKSHCSINGLLSVLAIFTPAKRFIAQGLHRPRLRTPWSRKTEVQQSVWSALSMK